MKGTLGYYGDWPKVIISEINGKKRYLSLLSELSRHITLGEDLPADGFNQRYKNVLKPHGVLVHYDWEIDTCGLEEEEKALYMRITLLTDYLILRQDHELCNQARLTVIDEQTDLTSAARMADQEYAQTPFWRFSDRGDIQHEKDEHLIKLDLVGQKIERLNNMLAYIERLLTVCQHLISTAGDTSDWLMTPRGGINPAYGDKLEELERLHRKMDMGQYRGSNFQDVQI